MLFSCTKSKNSIEASLNLPEKSNAKLNTIFEIEEPAKGNFFTNIGSIHVLSDGNLVVHNYPDHQLYELTTDGELVNIIGRKGRGPGEIIEAFRTFLAHDDSLHVFDFNNARHQIFKKNSEKKWVWHRDRVFINKVENELVEQVPVQIFLLDDGSTKGKFWISPGSSGIDTLSHDYMYMANVNHNIEHTGVVSRLKKTHTPVIRRTKTGRSIMGDARFWGAFYLFNPEKDEVIYVANNSNKIIRIDSLGIEDVKGLLPFEHYSLNEEKMDQKLRLIEQYSPELKNTVKKTFLNHEPYYYNIELHNNNLWVHLARSDSSKPNWVITTMEGEVIKAFVGPKEIQKVYIHNDNIYGVVRDENGTVFLSGYKLTDSY